MVSIFPLLLLVNPIAYRLMDLAKRIAFLKATKRENFKISKINHLQKVVSYFLMNIWSKITSIHPAGALGKEFCQRQVLQDFSFVLMFALPRSLCTTIFFW